MMRGRLKLPDFARLLSNRRGAAAVEFALVLPVLLAILMGIMDFGRAWNQMQVITDAAREGTRRAVVRDGAVKSTTVPAAIATRLNAANMSWDGVVSGYAADCTEWEEPVASTEELIVSGCGWGGDMGTEARVAIQAPYPFNFVGPVMRLLPGGNPLGVRVMTTNFVMRNE
jgi:Flp pilus assembly protein TadG